MAHSSTIKLHREIYWVSPYTFSVHVALREKGIPFENIEMRYDEDGPDSAGYLAKFVMGRVPSIEDGDLCLSESSAIVEYLDEKYPGPKLLPTDLTERAHARQLMAWIRSDLLGLREERSSETVFKTVAGQGRAAGETPKPLTERGRASAEDLVRVAGAVIPRDRDTLFSAWSIVDADLSFMLMRLIRNGHEVPAHVLAFAERHWRRPSVRDFVDHPRTIPYPT